MNKTFKSKQELRQAVWAYMEENNLVTFPRPCYGRIPNFVGSRAAAERLKTLIEWKEARAIFSAPDASLHPARCEALKEGKILLVAAPKLTGFYLIKDIPPEKAFEASSIKGFSRYGRPVKIDDNLPKIDLYLTGAVAVDKKGNRIGKGTGYGDKEDEILSGAGLIDGRTPRMAMVHEVQVFEDFSYLMEKKDKKVTIIVTPEKVYRV
ncbi:MAG: 5-formyltetrahydrofolate cyclo-ligase [Candidatus Brocadia sp.]|nr:5-formyltetrahydrofolate cyclo-ligase [Candidatus Brocadia sp.]